MESITATLRDGGEVIADNVRAEIDISRGSDGFMRMTGHFTESVPAAFGGTYTLEADDGRKGTIIVKTVKIGSHSPMFIEFVSSGPFA